MDIPNHTETADTRSSTSGDSSFINHTQLSVIASFLTLTGLLMVMSYLLVIVTVVRTRTLHTASNCFLANLAMSVIFFGVLGLPAALIFHSVGNVNSILAFHLSWIFGFSIFGYFFNTVLMAVDKWLKISHPFVYIRTMTRMRCTVCLAMVWVSSVVVSFLGAVIHTYSTNTLKSALESFTLMSVIYSLGIFLPCIVVVTVINISIMRTARHQAHAIAGEVPAAPRQIHRDIIENTTDEQRVPTPQNHADHRKSTRQFSIFFLSFVLTWVPMVTCAPIVHFTKAAMENITVIVVVLISAALALCQAAFGTLILTLLQPEFKQALKRNLKSLGEKLCCIRSS